MWSKRRVERLRKREDLKKKILECLSDKDVFSERELRDFLGDKEGLLKAAIASLSAEGKIVVQADGYTLSTPEARERYDRHIEAQRSRVKAILRERKVISERDLATLLDSKGIGVWKIYLDEEVSKFRVHQKFIFRLELEHPHLDIRLDPDFTFYCLHGQEKAAKRKALNQVRPLVLEIDGCLKHQRRFVWKWVCLGETHKIFHLRVCPICEANWIIERVGRSVPPDCFTLRQLGLSRPPEGAHPVGFISHRFLPPRAIYSEEDPVIQRILEEKEARQIRIEERREAYDPSINIDMVCIAIYTINKAAKRMKDASQKYYHQRLHGLAQFTKAKKEEFYSLKDMALEKIKALQLHESISFHEQTYEYETWEEVWEDEDDYDEDWDDVYDEDWDDDEDEEYSDDYGARRYTCFSTGRMRRVRRQEERTVYLEYLVVKGAFRGYGFHHHPTEEEPEGVEIKTTLPEEFSLPIKNYPMRIWQAEKNIQKFLQEGLN
jgi:hypothetical protein